MEYFLFFLDFIQQKLDNDFYLILFIFSIFLFFYHCFSLPGNSIFIISSGYFFDIYIGFFLSLITIVLGSFIFFIFSKFFLSKFFPKILAKYSNQIDKYLKDSSFEYLIMLRLIPGTPLMIQNILVSILNINKFNFMITTIIGFTPLVFTFVFFGYQLNNLSQIKNFSFNSILTYEFIIFLIFIIFLLFVRIYYKKRPSNK